MQKQKKITLKGEYSDNFTDHVLLSVFTKHRLNYKLLLITQDTNLASDILNLNNIQSVKANKIIVKRLNKDGNIDEFRQKKGKYSKPETNRSFKIKNEITSLKDKQLPLSYIPKENDYVISNKKKSFVLGKELGNGGEGYIYEVNEHYVAKIYKRDKNTLLRQKKIELMSSLSINYPGICYPEEILYNKNKEFIGYLMKKAEGKTLQLSLFTRPLFEKNFPHWTKKDTVELCLTILDKIKHLHDKNIILGDINPANIHIVSSKEVYFVDTDSYQIEDFPCPVGTINYTAPEIQGKNYSEFLRTKEHELFSVATLLFMIMLPGKPPYSQQGGEDPYSNIKNQDFSYPLGAISNKKTPEGAWRFIWSHLPYSIKEGFFYCFKNNERPTVDKWIKLFKGYLLLINNSILEKQDKMSLEIFPSRFKKSKYVNYGNCKVCNIEIEENKLFNGYCIKCSNISKFIRICNNCNISFSISISEYNHICSKGYALPKKCKDCRKEKSIFPTYGNNSNLSKFNKFLTNFIKPFF